ncbi:hypothetical protein [Catenovulum agarivorans]|uniref:hypothetical protein n=1 Tax=Catenovulum agarivorans TaxID=1172192 RepID=UPI0002D6DD2D|nr:hypothetical protein [Catenovulum agarivorans]
MWAQKVYRKNQHEYQYLNFKLKKELADMLEALTFNDKMENKPYIEQLIKAEYQRKFQGQKT